VTVVGHQFITLTVDICVQHGGPEAPRRTGLSAAAKCCFTIAYTQIRYVHEAYLMLRIFRIQERGRPLIKVYCKSALTHVYSMNVTLAPSIGGDPVGIQPIGYL